MASAKRNLKPHFEDVQALAALCKMPDLDMKLRPRIAKAAARIAGGARVSESVRTDARAVATACDPGTAKPPAQKP